MLARLLNRYSFLPLFLSIFLLSCRIAEACSCGPLPTVLDSFNHSDVVVVVSAVSVEKATPEKTAAPGRMSDGTDYVDGVMSTSMRVEQVFKGTVKVGDEMIFVQGGGADCIWTFDESDIGKKFLFYLKHQKNSNRWMGFTCGRSGNVNQAVDDLLYLNNLDKVRNRTRISGTLGFNYDAGESLAGRKIRIIGTKGSHEIKTDANGVYEIYDLPAGRYVVEPEIPKGWKIGLFWLEYSQSVDRNAKELSFQKIPINLEAKKHAGLDIMFEIDNAIRGHIYDPLGQPMNGVCLKLVPADGTKGPYLADCTEKGGAFQIDEIPPGRYVIVVNDEGKKTSTEPFGTFYYPNAVKREEATVFNIGVGDFIEDVEIYPAIEVKTVTVEGVFLYSDGKPVADERVTFNATRKQPAGDAADREDENDAGGVTDRKGRFSIKLVQGANGFLFGQMYSYIGEFENCPKLEHLIKQTGSTSTKLETPKLEIRATTNIYGVELKFPFPACKKAKEEQ
jgi:hypothetical protein